MTTVVAYARDGHTVMAADSMINIYDRPVAGFAKIDRRQTTSGDGCYLLGFAGEGAGPSILRAHSTVECLPDLTDETDRNAWANTVAQAVTDTYAEHLLLDDGRMGSNLILAVRGHVWTITHQQAIPHPDGYAAIGSGEGPAIGALHALITHGSHPVDAVVQACETGIRFDRYSGGKVTLAVL